MKTLLFGIALSVINFSAAEVFGQASNSAQTDAQQAAAIEKREKEKNAAQLEKLKSITENSKVTVSEETESSASEPKVNLKKQQKLSLQPDMRDLNFYREFLKQPNTGLIKLFPDAGCQDNARILRADEKCLDQIPNSSFYSFRREKHVSGMFADIRYKDGFFISDGILAQGIMTSLGDVQLDNISLAGENLRFLVQYQPAAVNIQAAAQMIKIVGGVKDGNYFYRNVWHAAENTTYVLRSIAYRGKIPYQFRGFVFNLLDKDKRKDITVIFRVVRKSSDGSVTLLWKELESKESPKLIVQKNNNGKR
jgi:hypothetical protein